MEAAVSSSLGAMGPLLRKLDLLMAPEYRLRRRLKDEIGLLKEDLEEVSSAVVELSTVETPSLRSKCWMEEARELTFDMEDFFDEMTATRSDADAKIRSVRSHRVGRVKIARLPGTPKGSTRISRITKFRTLLREASERHERYQLHGCGSSSSHVITAHGRVPALYADAANLIGIDDSKFKLTEMLNIEAAQQLKVVSIVGPAGVGKTTLAKEIYRELVGQFECRAFVRASRKSDMRRLLGAILSQVRRQHQPPSDSGPVQNLIDNLKEYLRDKRYFIVIDDLWEKTAWDIVSGSFPEGNNCSKIIATTENVNVALKCCGYLPNNILKMKPLGIHDSGKLFFSRVFGSEHQCPDEMKVVSYGIIRCVGLPLAIINLAGLLASQLDNSKLWYRVQDCLYSILNRSGTVEEIQKEIVTFSYNSLPHCLKTCLLYFNMYPEGFIIWKVHLLKQWISEGFINTTEGKETDEIAESYFDELVNRGMIQPFQIDYNDEVLSCTVHHTVHDLITQGSKRENFITAIDYSQTITGLSTKVRRLSLHFSSAKYAKQPAGITMPQLRSLAFFGLVKCMPSIVEFKLLRVVILEFWGNHDGRTSLNLSRICRLFQLRYLKISSDIMVELPSQMRVLQYLETLVIDARICAVPFDIVHLPSLLNLGLRDATNLPDGIGRIRSLRTLRYFDFSCNSEDNLWSLGKLTNLQHLHLTCSAALSDEHLKRKLIPLVSSLGKFGNLKSLTLSPGGLETAIFFDTSSSISSPSIFLQRLELLPPICFFSRLPSWIGQLQKLSILKIVVRELPGNDIRNLTGLPALTVLSLYVRTALEEGIVFTDMAFPALRYFKFRCSVMCLAFQAGAMPNLRRLKLCFNAHRGENYVRVLDGVEHLLSLQEIAGRIGEAPGADESNRRVVKSSFQDAIRKHPRCPSFNIQWVDLVEEEYTPIDKQHPRQQEGSSREHEIIERDYTEDTNRHAGSRFSGILNLPSASPSGHLKSDEATKNHVLASILRDESAEPTNLDLSLLIDITNNFSRDQEIGRGGSGVVYKGMLRDGIVAVKKLYGRHGQFAHIVHYLTMFKHSNIVRFLGYCVGTQSEVIKEGVKNLNLEQQDMFLIFEYLHNGSLQRHITDESCGLEWHTRYQIIKGICHGLDYLHEMRIVHLNLKPENILLDANMVPKIADHGYAGLLNEDSKTVTQNIVTSLDCMAPEYFEDGVMNFKSDIYSLGVIIMRIVSGHKEDPNIESVLGTWRSRLESDASQRHIELETAYHQVNVCIEIGIDCMNRDQWKRPITQEIINRLDETEITQRSIGSSVITSSVRQRSLISKMTDFFMQSMVPFKALFQQSGEVSKVSLSSVLEKDNLNHQPRIKASSERVIVLRMDLKDSKARSKAMKVASCVNGVSSIQLRGDAQNELVVVGNGLDPVNLCALLRKKVARAEIVDVGPAKPEKVCGVKATEKEKKLARGEEDCCSVPPPPYPYPPPYQHPAAYYTVTEERDEQQCTVQ